MAHALPTEIRNAPLHGEGSTLGRALALCAEVQAGAPARLAALRRLNRQSDADLAGQGRARDSEIRRTFADWFGF